MEALALPAENANLADAPVVPAAVPAEELLGQDGNMEALALPAENANPADAPVVPAAVPAEELPGQDGNMIEVYVVNSLLELRQLRHLFRKFPDGVLNGGHGYVRIRIQVGCIDRLEHTFLYQRILADFVEVYRCELHPPDLFEVASFCESLVVLQRMVKKATSNPYNGELFSVEWYQFMGRAAVTARRLGAFDDQEHGDFLFSMTKRFVSSANTGQELVNSNSSNERRWSKHMNNLNTLLCDVEYLLGSPVFF